MGDATTPSLVYSERAVPFALLAAADLLNVSVEAKPDAKLNKDAAPELVFPDRWGAGCSLRSSLACDAVGGDTESPEMGSQSGPKDSPCPGLMLASNIGQKQESVS